MLKKYITLSIIRLIQFAGLAILVMVLVPLFINHAALFKHVSQFFSHFKGLFLIGHGLFYTLLYFIWPKLVVFLSNQQHVKPNPSQINHAIQARVYLVAALVVFELLNVLR